MHPWIASFAAIPFELNKWVQSSLPKQAAGDGAADDSSDMDLVEEGFRSVRVV